MENFNFLGKKVNAPSKQLDTFEKPVDVQTVKFEGNELTGFCPVTHQPDFYSIIIEFAPDKLCIESKSLKLYLGSFRMHGEFHESCVNRICNDLVRLLAPAWLTVRGEFTPRGGIPFWPTAEYRKSA